jgi:hypothetical protein
MTARIRQAAVAAATGIMLSTASDFATGQAPQDAQRIRIQMGDKAVTATLNDSAAARDLIAMLPVSIRMRDHMSREKTGRIPGPLSDRTPGSRTYSASDLGYWRPGGNFVIFYRHDGLTIPPPGIVLLGRIDSSVDTFDVPGAIEVIVELIQ